MVLITRDRREEALRAVGALGGLPERPPVVVVDNGSTDGTASAVALRYPWAEVVGAGENLGAAGRNVGARRLAPWALRETADRMARARHDPVSRQGLRDALTGGAWVLAHRRVLPARVREDLQRLGA